MDQEKMAERRRLAAEKRRAEAAEEEKRRVEKEKQREEQEKLKLEPATIQEFDTIRGQLQTFHNEISILSKKTPDGPLNKFKLGFINEVLKKATAILGDPYRPFAGFETFSEAEMPTTSDVGLILSQYLNSMGRFKADHTYKDGYTYYWHSRGDDKIVAGGLQA